TLGRVIIRLLDATEGVVTFEGEDILRIRDLSALRRNMQIIFQDPFSSLNPRMTVGEILAEPLLIHRLCSGHAQRNKKV
ncbi:MAG: ATP-binding cassette domain-containing protein, partial [Oscillospiraceae bacterium]